MRDLLGIGFRMLAKEGRHRRARRGEDRGDGALPRAHRRPRRACRRGGRHRADPRFGHAPADRTARRDAAAEKRDRASAARRHSRASRRRGGEPASLYRAGLGPAWIHADRAAGEGRGLEHRLRDAFEVRLGRARRLKAQHLETDMVGAAFGVFADALLDRAGTAPGDDRVDQLVAAPFGEISVGPAETAQIVHVVVELEIALHVPPRGRARDRRVLAQNDGLLDREERTVAELPPRQGRVFDWNEIGVGAETALRREPEHLRTEGCEHPRHIDLRPDVRRGIHRVEVRAHVLEWARVVHPTRLDGRRVADAHPEKEAVRVRVDEAARSIRHRDRVAGPDVRDTAPHDELLAPAEKEAGVSEDLLASQTLRNPQRSVAERRDSLRVVLRRRSGQAFDVMRPNANRADPFGPRACDLDHRAKRTCGAFVRSNSLMCSGPSAMSVSRAAVASAMSAETSTVWQLGAKGRRRSMPSSRRTEAPWKLPPRQWWKPTPTWRMP